MHFLGKNIRYLRKHTTKTQSELATLIGKGQTTIGNWENGISEPSLEELLLLSNYFDIPLDILIKIDLGQTNWKVEGSGGGREGSGGGGRENPGAGITAKEADRGTVKPVSYDHANTGKGLSMVSEHGGEDLAFVLQEIRELRAEVARINARLSAQK